MSYEYSFVSFLVILSQLFGKLANSHYLCSRKIKNDYGNRQNTTSPLAGQ